MSGYPNQPPSYGYGYGAPPPSQSYGAPPSYQSHGSHPHPPPSQSYGAPPPSQSYGAPPPSQSYGAPPPSQSYGAPPPGSYGQPSAPYAAPYQKPPKEDSHSHSSGSVAAYPPPSHGSPFASLLPSTFPPGTDPSIVACFQVADQDGSGLIDDKELQRALSSYNQSFSLRTVHLLMYHFTNTNVKKIGNIQQELNNPTILSSWKPHTDCCNFNRVGVGCSSVNERVGFLSISNDTKLSAQFPPSIGNISYLETLFIYDLPNLTGTIPESITKLTRLRLKYLIISSTGVTGPIPKFTAQSKSLVYLDLSYNNLFGKLPPLLYKLPSLSGVFLNNNNLIGSIPSSYGYFNISVVALNLSRNNLSGKLPTSLAKLDIDLVGLAYNKFEGDASILFGSNKKTSIIDISGNNFEFDFGRIKLAKTIRTLDVSHNKIYGNFPMGMENVTFLNVSYNRLCGKIPKVGNFNTFNVSSFIHNKCLCGSHLPSCK